ncbi:unnamed protein product [Thlaspi arvense]|uniref:Replication factor-A protein 1 N-terminal domain-containing protein n=1 Tax=Thlaspi arvense TaxID=13288 RepID=A0AAU9T7G3_THLAR|nr:unnamed protein product [Thlaspi arvense]
MALTVGAVEMVLSGEVTSEKDMNMNPVLQVKKVSLVSINDVDEPRYIVVVSDGRQSVKAVLAKTLIGFVKENFIKVGSCVRLTQFGSQMHRERRFLYVVQLEVIHDLPTLDDAMSIESGELMSSVPESPPDSPEEGEILQNAISKNDASAEMKTFREALGDAKRFIHHTKYSKDEIRATIRVLNRQIDKLNRCWDDFSGVHEGLNGIHKAERPQSDDSEELSCDQLRVIAHSLLKFLEKNTLKAFATAFSPYVNSVVPSEESIRALQAAQAVLLDGGTSVYSVLHGGWDCKEHSEDEDEVFEW